MADPDTQSANKRVPKAPSPLTKRFIVDRLTKLGVRAGDHLLVHSALSSFGPVKGGADTVIDSLLEVVGEGGTVVVPTFGSPGDAAFDSTRSGTSLGLIPQRFWRRPSAVRSLHPSASVAAIGRMAQHLVADHAAASTAHGRNTPYYRLCELGGKVLLLGVDHDRSTFLHGVEAMARLPFLRTMRADYLDADGRKQTGSWRYFPGPHRDFIGLESWLLDNGLMTRGTIGPCVARLMLCGPAMDALLQRLEKEPALFISNNPNMHDGIWQKAATIRARWERLPFQLAADSRFAGRYLEQITDNLERFGLDRVVLSTLNRKPWQQHAPDKRRWYLAGLKQAGVRVAAVMTTACAPELARTLLKEARTDTLVVPATCDIASIVNLVASGVKVLVENTLNTSAGMLGLFDSLPAKAARNVRLAFNPLHFARVGENPFLHTYHTKIKRHIGALIVNDGLATGQRTPLEHGLGEIKELISILHSRSFDGTFVLQAPDDASFDTSMERFMAMLQELAL